MKVEERCSSIGRRIAQDTALDPAVGFSLAILSIMISIAGIASMQRISRKLGV